MLPSADVRSQALVHNVLLFGRLLRAGGVTLTAGREMELLEALRLIDLSDRERVYQACRAMLVSRRDHLPVFDRAFELFFVRLFQIRPPAEDDPSRESSTVEPTDTLPSEPGDAGELDAGDPGVRTEVAPAGDQEDEAAGEQSPEVQTYSPSELLRGKDFDDYTAAELARARELMRQLRLRPTVRRTRRMVRSPRGRRLDLRRVVRGMQRTAGEPAILSWRRQKLKRRQLVLLCDVSGSMERYSRVLLQFLHVARQGLADTEVFVFGTRLTRVTRDLAHRNVDAALDIISQRVLDFAGGTRIGRALHDFNRQWARRVLGHGAVVIVISDGWDRGDPELLRAEMEHLQRSCFRLIWLNPLLGLPEYEPVTLGMRTALQYVDDFMPAHNLASLERLAQRLSELEGRRPVRRQVAHWTP